MKRIVLILSVILHSLSMQGQFLPEDEIFYRTSRQSVLCPPEKVYMHTDRNTYVAGDTIWMRAHVVDGIAHVPMKLSAYVYVVLQNPFMETMAQVRLRADKEGIIHGHIPLPENLPKGEYMLCAYTQYMQNFDSDYFFKKQIVVNNVMNNSIRMMTSRRGRHLDVQFIDPVTGENKEIRNFSASMSSGEIDAQRKDNGYSVKIFDSDEKVVLIQAGNYREFVNFDLNPDYDVSFLPEGGNLVAGAFNRVAFKCLNSLGQGEDIIGTLRDEKDSVLVPFQSLYRGMGVVSFIPQRGKRYIAVCEDKNGVQKRFTLPEATDKYTMQVNQIRDKIYVKVLFSPLVSKDEKLLVFVHQRGWPIKIGNWKKRTPGLVCNREDFVEGAASFLLVNESGQIVSERMVFIQKDNPLVGKLQMKSLQPGKREKVSLEVQVLEKWWNGDCSVSVTDNHDVQPDSCSNILSSLLLSSDLRGHVEAPAWYFQKDENDSLDIRRQALDVLMMTQGWRKYDIRKAWAKVYKEPERLPERSQRITGRVMTRVSRKAVGKGKVQLMVPTMGIQKETRTLKDGTFSFEDFDAPDSTVFWVSTYTEKGKDNVVLELDTVIHPVSEQCFPPIRNNETHISMEYLAKADSKLTYDKGIRHLFLDEVIVTASRIKQETEYETNIMGTISLKEDAIEQSGTMDLFTFLRQTVPGIGIEVVKISEETSYETVTIRNSEVTFFVDGVKYKEGRQMELLRTIYKEDIQQIDVIKPPYSLIYDPMTTGGVIAITTKRGGKEYNARWSPTNLKHIMPLGFQLPVEFYSPRYELLVDKEKTEPDLRTTIHWQPRLEVKNGKAEIEFYTADGPVDYSVVIEGVGEDGSLLRVEKRIE